MNKVLNKLSQFRLGSTILLIIVVGVWSIPTFALLITSFRDRDLANTTGWWEIITKPTEQIWTFAAFDKVLNLNGLGAAFINTLVVTVPATILPIMIAAFAAYAFTFLEFKGREVLFAAIVALMVVPLQAALIPVLRGLVALKIATGFTLIGNFAGTWLMHSAFALPLAIYIFRNYMMTLPNALIEAARIDGASWWQIFWRLVIPMSVPSLASFAIFQFLWVWNDYLIAFIFVGTKNPVMTYQVLRLLGQYGDGWQNVAAASFVSLIVPLVVFFALQRYFVRGLTAGSVK